MRSYRNVLWWCFFVFLVVLIALGACAPAATVAPAAPAQPTQAPAAVEVTKEVEMPVTVVVSAPTQAAAAGAQSMVDPALLPKPNRLIIKNGEMKLEVENVDVAIDRVTQMVSDLGGYVVSSKTNIRQVNEENYKYASLTLGVPSADFETALRRLRQIARTVLDESASGEDVTDEYVDQESRLQNLKATRDRIREFLNQAKTVEEALKVNEQLKEVENEIEQVQGRMNYLFDRSAYSTISVNLEPYIPPADPTATPTPWPSPTPTPWAPGETYQSASATLGNLFRGIVNIAIYVSVVCVPFLIPLGFVAWLVIWRRKNVLLRRKATAPIPPPAEPAQAPVDQAPVVK
jgi:hypothetical protein